MSVIFPESRTVSLKIVYYGPPSAGKTTNLQYIYQKLAPDDKGPLTKMPCYGDTAVFFRFFPIDVGEVDGYHVRLHLYTVQGDAKNNATRKLIIKGADGVVFVADSQKSALTANVACLENLIQNGSEVGLDPVTAPFLFQYNKRDLKTALPIAELNEKLNRQKAPVIEATARKGYGVMETLTAVSRLAIQELRKKLPATSKFRGADVVERSLTIPFPRPELEAARAQNHRLKVTLEVEPRGQELVVEQIQVRTLEPAMAQSGPRGSSEEEIPTDPGGDKKPQARRDMANRSWT
jgi:signal recognition particle receptor subunit beta